MILFLAAAEKASLALTAGPCGKVKRYADDVRLYVHKHQESVNQLATPQFMEIYIIYVNGSAAPQTLKTPSACCSPAALQPSIGSQRCAAASAVPLPQPLFFLIDVLYLLLPAAAARITST